LRVQVSAAPTLLDVVAHLAGSAPLEPVLRLVPDSGA
jgi:hypothetical protein